MQNKMTPQEWFEKGLALVKLGRYKEALDAFDKATEMNPQFILAWCNKATSLGVLGRYKEAQDAHSKAIEINPQLAR